MPVTDCDICGGPYHWKWEEAFDKFGFMDGDGQVETWRVETVLTQAGYEVRAEGWGMHNTVIISITKDGEELIPHNDPKITFGFEDPRTYLPKEIIQLLDRELPEE